MKRFLLIFILTTCWNLEKGVAQADIFRLEVVFTLENINASCWGYSGMPDYLETEGFGYQINNEAIIEKDIENSPFNYTFTDLVNKSIERIDFKGTIWLEKEAESDDGIPYTIMKLDLDSITTINDFNIGSNERKSNFTLTPIKSCTIDNPNATISIQAGIFPIETIEFKDTTTSTHCMSDTIDLSVTGDSAYQPYLIYRYSLDNGATWKNINNPTNFIPSSHFNYSELNGNNLQVSVAFGDMTEGNGYHERVITLKKVIPEFKVVEKSSPTCIGGTDGSYTFSLSDTTDLGSIQLTTYTLQEGVSLNDLKLHLNNLGQIPTEEPTDPAKAEALASYVVSGSIRNIEIDNLTKVGSVYQYTVIGDKTKDANGNTFDILSDSKVVIVFETQSEKFCFGGNNYHEVEIPKATPDSLDIASEVNIPDIICKGDTSVSVSLNIHQGSGNYRYHIFDITDGIEVFTPSSDTIIGDTLSFLAHEGKQYQVVVHDLCHGEDIYSVEDSSVNFTDTLGVKKTEPFSLLNTTSNLEFNTLTAVSPSCSNENGSITAEVNNVNSSVKYLLYQEKGDSDNLYYGYGEKALKESGWITNDTYEFKNLDSGVYTVIVLDQCRLGSNIDANNNEIVDLLAENTFPASIPNGIILSNSIEVVIPPTATFTLKDKDDSEITSGSDFTIFPDKADFEVNVILDEAGLTDGTSGYVKLADRTGVVIDSALFTNESDPISFEISPPSVYDSTEVYSVFLYACDDTLASAKNLSLTTPISPSYTSITSTDVDGCYDNGNGTVTVEYSKADIDAASDYLAKLQYYKDTENKFVDESPLDTLRFTSVSGNDELMSATFDSLLEGEYRVVVSRGSIFNDTTVSKVISTPSQYSLTATSTEKSNGTNLTAYGASDGEVTFEFSGGGEVGNANAYNRVLTINGLGNGVGIEENEGIYYISVGKPDSIELASTIPSVTIKGFSEGSNYLATVHKKGDPDCISDSATFDITAPPPPNLTVTGTTREILDQIVTTRSDNGNDVPVRDRLARLAFFMSNSLIRDARFELRKLVGEKEVIVDSLIKSADTALDSVIFDGLDPGQNYSIYVKEAWGNVIYDGYRLLPLANDDDAYFSLTEPGEIYIHTTLTKVVQDYHISCYGGEADTVKITVNGGEQDYTIHVKHSDASIYNSTFSAIDTSSTIKIPNLVEGTYTISVTDFYGYQRDTTFTLVAPDPLDITYSHTKATCFNKNNASISVSEVTGGIAPYTVELYKDRSYNQKIENVATHTATQFEELYSGSYTLKVIDAEGCDISTNTITLKEPPPIKVKLLKSVKPLCFNDQTGAIKIEVEGGTPSAEGTYKVYAMNGADQALSDELVVGASHFVKNNFNDSLLFDSLVYHLVVTDTYECPCDSIISDEITSIPLERTNNSNYTEFAYKVDSYPRISLTSEYIAPTCYGSDDGKIVITDITGGNPFNNRYAIQVFSASDIDSPLGFTGTNGIYNRDNSNSSTFLIYDGETISIGGLLAGNYILKLSYALDESSYCEDSKDFDIQVFEQEIVSISPADSILTNVSICFGENNGQIDYAIQTDFIDNRPITFELYQVGETNYKERIVRQNSSADTLKVNFPNLYAGDYIVKVYHDCRLDTLVSSIFEISEPTELILTEVFEQHREVSLKNARDGVMELSISGDGDPTEGSVLWIDNLVEGYGFELVSPNTYRLTETGADSIYISNNSELSIRIEELYEGTYDVILASVTTLSCNTSLSVNIDAPDRPSMSFEASSTRVALDQILTTRPTYGNEDYDVVEPGDLGSIRFKMGTVITPAQLELRSVSDTSYTLLSSISDSVTVSDIDPGVAYELFVHENSDVETLNYDGFRLLPIEEEVSSFELREPAPLAIVIDSLTNNSGLAISCFEGLADSIAVNVSGGVPPYTVDVFSDEITLSLSNVQSDTFVLNQLTEDRYAVQITDANGYDSTFTDAFEINDPDQIELFYSLKEANCNGDANGIVYIDSIKGGTKPYTINLNKVGYQSSRSNYNGNTIEQFTGLESGNYQIEIIDAAACTTFFVNGEQRTSYEVEILQPEKLKVVLLESIKPECLGERTGGMRLKVEGGRPLIGGQYKVYSSLVEDITLPNQFYTVDTLTYNVVDGEDDYLVFDSLEYYLTVTDSERCPCEIVEKENDYPNETVLKERASDHLYEFKYKVASYPRITLTTSQDGPFCYGANDGVFHIRNITGGKPSIVGNYTISIRSGADTLTFFENPDGSYVYDSGVNTTLLSYSDSLDLSGFVAGDYQFDVYYDISENQLCKDDSVFSFRFEGPEQITRTNDSYGVPKCHDGFDASYTIDLNGGRSGNYQILLSEQEFDGNKSKFKWTNLTISDSIPIDFSYQQESEDFKIYASWNNANNLSIYGLKGGKGFNLYVRDKNYFDENNEDKEVYNLGSCEELFGFTTENTHEISYQLTDKEDLSCYEGGDGQLGFKIIGGDSERLYTITLSNNSQDYQFVDVPLNTKVIFTDLSAGKYTLFIEDSLGCNVNSHDIQLSQPNLNRIVEIRSQLQACNIYTLEVRMDGNPSNYDFEVSTTPKFEIENTSSYTSHLIENIGVGNYWVRAINTENGSCFVEDSISLTAQNFAISSLEGESIDDIQKIQLSCSGDLTDIHLHVVEGNVGQIEYAMFEDADGNNMIENWTSTNAFELGEGTYYFKAKDNFGCTSEVFKLQITAPEQLLVDRIVIEDAACSNAANGVLSFHLTGGVSPYLIQIDDLSFNVNENDLIANTFTIYNLDEGIHTLRVVDDSSCSTSQEITVETKDELSINLLEVTPDYCQFNNGGGTLGVEGNLSTINWSYQLDQIGSQKNSLFVDLEGNFDGLAAGDYIFFAEDDSTTCSVSLLVSIPSEDAFSFYFTPTDLAACGEANGRGVIEVISSDVIENSYEILELDESLRLDSANYTLGLFYISGLSAGINYPIIINAESNCSVEQYISIGSIDSPSLFDSTLVSHPTCELSNGTYSISFTGGTAPYQITSLSNAASISKTAEIASEESVLISNLGAGTHYVSFSDNRGCSNTLSFTIESVREEFGSYTFEKTLSHCGKADGSIVFLPDNAEDYTASEYVWHSEDWQQIALGSRISDISAGVYYLEIRRADSCGDTLQVSLTDSEVQPQITNVETTLSACNKAIGTAKVSSTLNVTTALTYIWLNLNGEEIAETQVASLSSLSAGEYSVKLIDQNGCGSERFYFSITEMEAMEVSSVSLTDVSCNGGNDGAISVSITKGLAPYRYSWNGEAFVEDLSTKENLAAGTHSLQVLDANNCLFEITAASNILVINEPHTLSVFAESQDISCFDGANGQATLSYFGGTPPYAFKWYNERLQTIATTEQVNDLVAGKYFIEIQDANNCLALDSIQLTAPDSLELTLVASLLPSCTGANDARASVQVNGGTLPYSYLWDNGETTLLADSLTSGIHSVTVTDAMLCSKTLEVNIPERTPITFDYEVTDPLCQGDNSGTLRLNISGGAGEYFVDWGSNVIGTTRTGLGLGSYTFTITDKNGCQLTDVVTIGNQPRTLVATLDTVMALSCYGGADAAIKIAIDGGTAPYRVSWSNHKRGTSIGGLTSGTYTATVIDSQNCQTTLSVVIAEPEGITIVIPDSLKQLPSCYGGTDGIMSPLVSGGEKPYTFTWSNGSKDSIATQLISGVYSLTVEDANGCSSFLSNIKLEAPEQIILTLDSLQKPLCVGANNGEAYLSASGGDGQYEFVWEDGLIASTRTDLSAGKYVVTVYDGKGCSDELTIRLTDPKPLKLSISQTMPICFESCSGQAQVIVTGGTAPYTYTWSSGSQTQQATNLCEGTYSLIVQDANGCQAEGSVTLIDPAPLEITEIESEYTLCEGQELVLNPEGYASYHWTSVNGLDYSNSEIVLTAAGIYTLNVSSEDGCVAEKSFTLNYLDNILETDFVINSEAVVGDTVVFVDITWPRTDNVSWAYPESDKVKILETDSIHRQEAIFSEEGSYEFTMYVASESGCTDSVTKWIEVVASIDTETNTRKQESTSNFINIQAKPNPVSDLLNVKVALEKAEPVRLMLRGMLGHVYFEYLENSGSTQISKEWNLSKLPTGIYIIEIITVTERSSRKVSKY